MTFSQEWDQRYIANTHLSVWPWSDLVSLVRRHFNHSEGGRVLELGCGAGANIPFFQSLGVQYHSIEGSTSIVERLHERFPDLVKTILVGDFTASQPFDPGFDLVVDRASLTCNDTQGIERGLQLAWDALREGAYLIGVDWFSMNHSEFGRSTMIVDEHTRTGYQDGPFVGTGRVHFSDESHLRMLLSDFELVFLEEKVLHCVVPVEDYQLATWNFVARKREGNRK